MHTGSGRRLNSESINPMEILRTRLELFDALDDFPYKARFIDFRGMRMHYIDENKGEVFLALHGEPSWSYLYRKFVPLLGNYRFVAPDLIGFGKSDKLSDIKEYSFKMHFDALKHLIDTLKLEKINLIVQDWGGLLGLSLLGAYPEKFSRVIIMNTFLPRGKRLPLTFRLWQAYSRYHPSLPVGGIIQRLTTTKLDKKVVRAYNLPYPDKLSKAGVRAFPQLVPSSAQDPAMPYLLAARKTLSEWQKPALVMFSDKDPVFSGLERFFLNLIPSCQNQPEIIISNAGHFLQEDKADEICHYINMFMEDKIPR